MSRLELIVQQIGREPRLVPLTKTMIVGRSRRADLTIDDEEVGREQFRVGIDGGDAFVEGIGTTNQTIVDGSPLASGARRRLVVGGTVRVGRTTLTLRDDQATADGRPGSHVEDMTMVAPRPTGSPPTGSEPPGSATESPLRTMPGVRPGARPAPGSGDTHSASPGAAAGPAPKAPNPAPSNEPEQTMQLRGGQGYRPGQAMPPSPPAEPPDRTAMAAGPAPAPPPRPTPATTPAPPAAAAPPPPSPPPPRQSATTTAAAKPLPPTAPPKPAADRQPKATTVAVNPVDIAAEIGKREPAGSSGPVDVEARLHESQPRLFVKCEGLKRRMRLMKARNMLGRAESVDVLLPNESVSEQHAEITFDGKTWTLRDRGSTNGSFVDGGQLRGGSQELQRHSIIGLGNVRAIFLCNDRRDPAGQKRLEERAVKLLVQAGRLQGDAGREAVRVARADPSQSIPELLLMDTPLTPAEWATAVTTARGQTSFLDSLKRMLERLRRDRRASKRR